MSTDIVSSLKKHFGFTSFRPGQAEAIESLLKCRHTLVVMPTGSGKSLVYQLAALHLPGITLVISPLIALMKDQVDSLERRNISATFINSTLSSSEQSQRLKSLVTGCYRIIYIAPERLRSNQFIHALQHQKVSLLAVDEAHCISEWGHDFRPDYLHIAQFRAVLGNPLTTALTATATPQVQDDIARLLDLTPVQRVVTGFNRPNLALEVRYITDSTSRLRALKELLTNPGEGATIIYTGTRRDAEEVADFVSTVVGSKALHYHAGLPTEDRTRIQDEFMSGDLSIVAATNAFGMGIDRPDVRQVIHYALPGSLEAYYQEAGRAGRDELPAKAVLLYSPEDRALQEWFIENSTITTEDLRLLFETLHPKSDRQESITMSDISTLTGMQEVKARVGLAVLERAGVLEHQGDEGMRMRVKLHGWKAPEIHEALKSQQKHQAHRKTQLEHMIAYAESNVCRRGIILKHFGDAGPAEAAICCDNCQARQPAHVAANDIDTLSQSERVALIILDTAHRLRNDVGSEKLTQILRGSKAKDILKFHYDKNTYYGRLAVFSHVKLQGMIHQLIELRYFKVVGGKYPVLHLTPQGEAALRTKTAIPLKIPQIQKQQLPPNITRTIIECVRAIPGKLTRSGVAKLLIGSKSGRLEDLRSNPFFNKLSGYHRYEILGYIDRMLANGQLTKNESGYLTLGNKDTVPSPSKKASENIIQHIVALGDDGSIESIPELIIHLQSGDGNVRRLAASALGKIPDKRSTQPLIELLSREEKHQVRQYAVKALGKIRDKTAAPILQTIMNNPQEKEYTRVAARNALKRLEITGETKTDSTDPHQTQLHPDDPIAAFLSRSHPRQLPGPWDAGWALGFHSQFTGANWKRSDAGELAYRLKYQDDLSVLPKLVEQAAALIADHPELAQVDAIVPVPPSTPRLHDPVSSFAKALSTRFGLAYLPVLVKSRQTSPQKELHTLAQKRKNVAGAFELQLSIRGKRLLVVDDLFDSGATLEEIYHLLQRVGATKVCVLTLTRTIHSDA